MAHSQSVYLDGLALCLNRFPFFVFTQLEGSDFYFTSADSGFRTSRTSIGLFRQMSIISYMYIRPSEKLCEHNEYGDVSRISGN